MKNLLVALIICTLAISSCLKDPKDKPLTFDDIEKEFHFSSPLTDLSKKNILEKWNSVENYREHLLHVVKLRNEKIFSNSNFKKSGTNYQVYITNRNHDYQYTRSVGEDEYIHEAMLN